MKITKEEAKMVLKNAQETGYEPKEDRDYTSQNWHASDDSARAVVKFSSLSKDTRKEIEKKAGSVPADADVIFRWNIEMGTLADVVAGDKFIRSFCVEELPWFDDSHDQELEDIKKLIKVLSDKHGDYDFKVRPQEDGERYELYVKGELYSNYLSSHEAWGLVMTLYKGIALANKELAVPTSAGIIKACANPDPGQPGICVMLQPAGLDTEIDMSFVSVYEDPKYVTKDNERPVDVAIMTYANVFDEDYSDKKIIRREDVMEALDIPVTWDDIYVRAEGTACGSPELRAKDDARGNVGELSRELWGYDPEKAEIPEEEIERICMEHRISFDIKGNILSYDGKEVAA